jgi:histidine ammonia-lyase
MSALVALAVADSKRLLKIADLVGALTTYVLNGNISQFDEELQKVRPHIGQALTAENMRKLMGEGVPSSRNIQDAYSLRCIPQVHGAIRTAVEHARQVLEIEVNSATDNPLVFPETGKILSGGNFHGEPIALIADYLKIALAELGNISERRINRLLHPDLNGDLPPFLAQNPGLSSGYMLAHYTAAGLASENKVLAHPSSVDSIPLSGDQEDHVSMGTNAARHLREVVKNTGYILAIELLCACQAREFISRPMPKALAVAYQTVREEVPALKKDKDEEVYEHIEMASKIVWGDTLLGAVEEVIGSLN